MATITHSNAAKAAATDAVVDLLDVGTTNAGGTLRLRDGTTTVCDLLMSATAFGAADTAGTATAAAIANGTAAATGTVDGFQALDKDETLIFSGTAGVSHAITGVSTVSKTFTVGTDLSSILAAGDVIRVSGSTGNDGFYTVVSVSTGTITVVETISSATVDGTLHPYAVTLDNTSINSGQTVSCSSFTHNACAQ